MSKDDSKKPETVEGGGQIERRVVLGAAAAAAVASAVPGAALSQVSLGTERILAGVYANPLYLVHFNAGPYSSLNIKATQGLVLQALKALTQTYTPPRDPVRSDLIWGIYQKTIEPNRDAWSSTSLKVSRFLYDNWENFRDEARLDLEKLPDNSQNPENRMNPFDTTQIAGNLLQHLDEVIRIALWDYAVPITISVNDTPGHNRHNGLITTWYANQKLQLGLNPNVGLTGLTIQMNCPKGGWQGYAIWRADTPDDHQITRFVSTWQVPPEPKNNQGDQIIFIFNGLESVTSINSPGGILQPILQWTKTGWYIRSWYVTSNFDPVANPTLPDPNNSLSQANMANENRCYSVAVKVKPGDKITGVIAGGMDTSGNFNYESSLLLNDQLQSNTVLSVSDIPQPCYAVCAIESYLVQNRATDYPGYPNAITMSSVGLQVDQAAVTPVTWTLSKPPGKDFTTWQTPVGNSVAFLPK